MFRAVTSAGAMLDMLAEAWISRFEASPATACRELCAVLFNAAGVADTSLPAMLDASTDVGEALDQALAGSAAPGAAFLAGKTIKQRETKEQFCEFWRLWATHAAVCMTLVPAGSADAQDVPVLWLVVGWLADLSSASARAVRQAATLASMAVGAAVAARCAELASVAAVGSTQPGAPGKRARAAGADTAQTASALQETREVLDDIFTLVFMHRYRDVHAPIRAEALEGLAGWLGQWPGELLSNRYLKYTGWMLSDRDAHVRQAAVDALASVLRMAGGAIAPKLQDLMLKFRARLHDMACRDVNAHVAAGALGVLSAAAAVGLGDPADVGAAELAMVNAAEHEVRAAAAELVVASSAAFSDAYISELVDEEGLSEEAAASRAVQDRLLTLVDISERLISGQPVNPDAELSEDAALALAAAEQLHSANAVMFLVVDAFYSVARARAALLKFSELGAFLLSIGTSAGEPEQDDPLALVLTPAQLALAATMLHAAVQAAAGQSQVVQPGSAAKPADPASRVQRALVHRMTVELMPVLPSLMQKFKAARAPAAAAAVLQCVPYLDFDACDKAQEGAFEWLGDAVVGALTSWQHDGVLQAAAVALSALSCGKPGTTHAMAVQGANIARQALKRLADGLAAGSSASAEAGEAAGTKRGRGEQGEAGSAESSPTKPPALSVVGATQTAQALAALRAVAAHMDVVSFAPSLLGVSDGGDLGSALASAVAAAKSRLAVATLQWLPVPGNAFAVPLAGLAASAPAPSKATCIASHNAGEVRNTLDLLAQCLLWALNKVLARPSMIQSALRKLHPRLYEDVDAGTDEERAPPAVVRAARTVLDLRDVIMTLAAHAIAVVVPDTSMASDAWAVAANYTRACQVAGLHALADLLTALPASLRGTDAGLLQAMLPAHTLQMLADVARELLNAGPTALAKAGYYMLPAAVASSPEVLDLAARRAVLRNVLAVPLCRLLLAAAAGAALEVSSLVQAGASAAASATTRTAVIRKGAMLPDAAGLLVDTLAGLAIAADLGPAPESEAEGAGAELGVSKPLLRLLKTHDPERCCSAQLDSLCLLLAGVRDAEAAAADAYESRQGTEADIEAALDAAEAAVSAAHAHLVGSAKAFVHAMGVGKATGLALVAQLRMLQRASRIGMDDVRNFSLFGALQQFIGRIRASDCAVLLQDLEDHLSKRPAAEQKLTQEARAVIAQSGVHGIEDVQLMAFAPLAEMLHALDVRAKPRKAGPSKRSSKGSLHASHASGIATPPRVGRGGVDDDEAELSEDEHDGLNTPNLRTPELS